jgi:hypothetical protein
MDDGFEGSELTHGTFESLVPGASLIRFVARRYLPMFGSETQSSERSRTEASESRGFEGSMLTHGTFDTLVPGASMVPMVVSRIRALAFYLWSRLLGDED